MADEVTSEWKHPDWSTPEEESQLNERLRAQAIEVARRLLNVAPTWRSSDIVASVDPLNPGSFVQSAPIFSLSRRRTLITASRALDETDASVASSHVTVDPAITDSQHATLESRVNDALSNVADQISSGDILAVSTNATSTLGTPAAPAPAAETPLFPGIATPVPSEAPQDVPEAPPASVASTAVAGTPESPAEPNPVIEDPPVT